MLAAQFPTGDVIKLCLLLSGAVCVLGVLVWLARRMLLPRRDDVLKDEWSLQGLRELRADGRITEQEFEALKQRLLATMRGPKKGEGSAAADREGEPSSEPRGNANR